MAKFSQKVIDIERKCMAAIIAETTGQQVKYAGVPTYAYEIGGWSIDRDGVLYSTAFDTVELPDCKQVLNALNLAGFTTEGDLCITLSSEGHTEFTRHTLSALIASKVNLFKKVLSRPASQDWTVSGKIETELKFTFLNTTLDFNEVKAFILFSEKLSQRQVKALKYCSAKEKAVENEKYAMGRFLLRLGFIDEEYKLERKILLGKLSTTAAFKYVRQ